MADLTHHQLTAIAEYLDDCVDMYGNPLGADARTRVFAVIEDPSWENWRAARCILIRPTRTLWHLVSMAGNLGSSSRDTPSRAAIMGALADAGPPAAPRPRPDRMHG